MSSAEYTSGRNVGILIQNTNMKKRKKIVLLLGAGFPVAWGASFSKDILDRIIEDKEYMYDSNTTWGKFIFDTLKSFYEEEDGVTVNFETVIAASESIMNYVIASTNENRNSYNTSFTPAVNVLIDSIQQKLNEISDKLEKRRHFYSIYKHFVDIVIQLIKGYDEKACAAEYKLLNERLNEFIESLLNKKYSVKIYTTNYDAMIPQILSKRKIYMGEHLLSDYSIVYKADYLRNKDSHLSYFYLHGSIYWTFKFVENKYRVVKSTITGEVQSLTAQGGNPSENLIFSPIIVGYTKTQRSLINPFNIGFTNFANDCNDCNKLLTIGYSFSDPHINSIIQTNVDFNKVRLACIGFVERFEGSSEYTKIDYFIRRLYKKNEDESWFNSINNNFVAYKKGFLIL